MWNFQSIVFVWTQTYMEIFKLALPLSESTLCNCLSVNELFAMGLELTNTKFVKWTLKVNWSNVWARTEWLWFRVPLCTVARFSEDYQYHHVSDIRAISDRKKLWKNSLWRRVLGRDDLIIFNVSELLSPK